MPRAALPVLLVLALASSQAATPADQAVVAALGRAAPQGHAAVIRRLAADDELDVVLAIASTETFAISGRYWWNTKDRLGLFLQSRADRGRVYRLAIEPGPNDDCSMAIERMTREELVLSCTGEKWSTYDNRKFVYDVHAKALVKQFSYAPFHAVGVDRAGRGPRFLMSNGSRDLLVAVSAEGEWQVWAAPAGALPGSAETFGPGGRFRLSREKNRFGSEFPAIVEVSGGGERRYELPQSGFETWRAARPDYVGSRPQLDPDEKNEQIGPHQVLNDRLWFGKTFYDGEGLTGVGGFGYFDFGSRAFRLFSPPEVQRWSVSAILIEPEAAWLGLERRGEYGDTPGGLLRWEWQTERVRTFAATSIVTSIVRHGDALYMGANDGLLVLGGDKLSSFFIDRTSGGSYRVVPRE